MFTKYLSKQVKQSKTIHAVELRIHTHVLRSLQNHMQRLQKILLRRNRHRYKKTQDFIRPILKRKYINPMNIQLSNIQKKIQSILKITIYNLYTIKEVNNQCG